MIPSSAQKFAFIPELLRYLGIQIGNRKLLRELCLASKAFNAAFSPFLYYVISIEAGAGRGVLQRLLRSPHLGHVKELVASHGQEGSHSCGDEEFNEHVQRLLAKIPSLRAFTWSQLPLATTTVDSLRESCSGVKSLSIDYPTDMESGVLRILPEFMADGNDLSSDEEKSRQTYRRQGFTFFSDLKCLTLYGLHDDLPAWKSQIAKILLGSPHLERLGLSIANESVSRLYSDRKTDIYGDLFDDICNKYEQAGGKPLPLRSLKCGSNAYLGEAASLPKLTQVGRRDVHMENCGVWDNVDVILMYDDPDDGSGIPFSTFGPSNCPKLRRFTANQCAKDVWDLIYGEQAHSSFARNLAIFFEYEMDSDWDPAALLLRTDAPYGPPNTLQLRMMGLELERTGDPGPDEEDQTPERILARLVETNGHCLEGLAVHLPQENEDDGSPTTLDLLADALERLPRLTQLALIVGEAPEYRGPSSDHFRRGTAEWMARVAPSLRYISVQASAWAIWRVSDTEILLEELDGWEIEDVELFAHNLYSHP